MSKTYKVIIFLLLMSFSFSSNAHVQHYENLNRIEFDIYRNNKHIGTHVFSFKISDNELAVRSKINFEIKKLGILLYEYVAEGTEIYKDGKLIKFNSRTDQNGKIKRLFRTSNLATFNRSNKITFIVHCGILISFCYFFYCSYYSSFFF